MPQTVKFFICCCSLLWLLCWLVVFQIELVVDVVDCCEDIEESEAEEEFGVPIPPVLLLPLPPLPL